MSSPTEHEAVASEVGLTFSTFKPSKLRNSVRLLTVQCYVQFLVYITSPYVRTSLLVPVITAYVWSLDLIPMFVRLNQTLEGLFKVSLSSLTFALIQVRQAQHT